MKIFDDILRTDKSPALNAEPEFNFLNRSARSEILRIGQLLEEWFGRYPTEHKWELRQRLRSEDDIMHRSAFFELLLHELLIRLDCEVTVHPAPNDDMPRRPDFLAKPATGNSFYMEATLATEETAEESKAKARINVVYDALNRLKSPNFFIGIDLKGAPKTSPPASRMRSFLKQRLAELDPDDVALRFDGQNSSALPRWAFDHDGWHIEFYPIPKSTTARGNSDTRPLGMRVEEFSWVDSKGAIRNAVLDKAGRYGHLNLPYIIAVNALGVHVDREDIVDALIGDTQYMVNLDDPSSEATPTRNYNGAWTTKTGPRYTRVSAVLMFHRLLAGNIPAVNVCLYHNPWATREFTSVLTQLPQVLAKERQLEWMDGMSLGKLFGLAPGWPELRE